MNAEEIAKLCDSLTLKENEGPLMPMCRELTNDEVRGLALRLIGKLLSNKSVNKEAFMIVMPKIWRTLEGFEIEVIDGNTFSFTFKNGDDRRRILRLGHVVRDCGLKAPSKGPEDFNTLYSPWLKAYSPVKTGQWQGRKEDFHDNDRNRWRTEHSDLNHAPGGEEMNMKLTGVEKTKTTVVDCTALVECGTQAHMVSTTSQSRDTDNQAGGKSGIQLKARKNLAKQFKDGDCIELEKDSAPDNTGLRIRGKMCISSKQKGVVDLLGGHSNLDESTQSINKVSKCMEAGVQGSKAQISEPKILGTRGGGGLGPSVSASGLDVFANMNHNVAAMEVECGDVKYRKECGLGTSPSARIKEGKESGSGMGPKSGKWKRWARDEMR
ncbi:hypothetical protein Dsin_018525 [Dipteronia sinensis]|uniref:DUF4283 domain-containing protein n=1 Tax=Dipteronia sinensis TaxID=43782 RepID=A0AAE0E369_9ROSI|nr:hypothetical protein Dsin_018525 [Dipteronia sinensis]